MAMKLGIAPTFQLSCRFQHLLSFRHFSSSYALLVRFPISQSTFARLRLWRRSISSGPSDDSGWKKPKQDEPPERKKAIAYDLSSGFLQDRRRTTQTSTVRRLPEDDEDDDDDDDDWNNVIKNRASDNRNSRVPPTSDSDEEDSLSDDFDDGEIGGWMGNREPSNTFRRSSLYKQPLSNKQQPSSYKQQPSSYKQASDYDTKPQKSERLVKFPPVPPAGPKPKQKPKVAVANRYEIYSDTPSFATETSPETKTSEGDITESSETGGDELKDFIPAVIKPEEPYIYSYTETPKVAPLGFREPVYSPFGPEGVNRPWTGRPPLAKSKKKPKEFDSFNPPPPGKKGVKPVNQPGPFLEGDGPKLGRSREEILGAPLLPAEVRELVMRSQKEVRQLNLGRDGLTHNMLNLVHEHWKRRRVCKIKCKGVPTVDMDNVCKVLEEKSGGKIIQRTGGVIYIFRGRNYNYKTRPVIPLMLWKPPTPIYPKLVEKAPPGLTLEEANEMRKLGRKLAPICRLAKNGVYINLVQDVRNAFRADDLVKVDCQGLNPSDFKKIGAKLKDLVPCILISFERESILMWKGHNSPLDSQDGVNGENSGEAVPPFKRDLSEEGQELLERTLDGAAATDEGDEIVASAADEDDEDYEIVGSTADEDDEDDEIVASAADEDDEDDESEASIDVGAAYEDDSVEEEGEDEATIPESMQDTGSMEDAGVIDEEVDEAVAEFESLWEEAIESEEVLILDEDEVGNPDTIFEVVKTHFGGPLGAPAKPRNKRNSNELVGKKALQKAKPRLDPAVLDRVPKDPSGLLEIDELAKLLAP